MFQFSRFASIPYVFRYWYPCGWVSPFRNLRIKAYLPAPRSLSQAITSFFACNRQGIHHMLLVTWPYNFDFCCQNVAISGLKDWWGLAPHALCRNVNDSSVASFQTQPREWFVITSNSKWIRVTQSNSCWRHGAMFHAFRQQRWFRLYEFLKNSLLRQISIQKQSLQDCFCIEVSLRL